MPARFLRIVHQHAQVSSFETFYSNPESLAIVLLSKYIKQDALSDIQLDRVRPLITPPGALKKASTVWFIHFNNLSHLHINETLPTNPSLTKSK